MVTLATIEKQLKAVGCNFRFWGRAELRELCHVLLPGETIAMAVNGQYEGGFALLCATDYRVLLIDKKPRYLTLKDIRFDMITELDYGGGMLNSTVRIYTPNKEMKFSAMNSVKLRKLFTHTQHKVMELRHHFMMQQFQQQHDAQNTPPGIAMMQMQQLPQGPEQPLALPPQANAQWYNSAQTGIEEHHRRLIAAMGATGLRHVSNLAHNGQVIKEYISVPFQQRWRKRPYGFSRDALPEPEQNS